MHSTSFDLWSVPPDYASNGRPSQNREHASLTVCRENAANLENFQTALAADSILVSAVMAIYRLLQNHAFESEAIMTMAAAYDEVLHTLCLAHRSDPITWIVAEKVIQFAQRGERDPVRLRELALESLSSN